MILNDNSEIKPYLDGIMYFVKIFKNANKKYFCQYGNRMFSIFDGGIYDARTFLAEIELSFDCFTRGKYKSVLDKYFSFIMKPVNYGILQNPVCGTCFDVDEFYSFYQKMKNEKLFNTISSMKIETINPISDPRSGIKYYIEISNSQGEILYNNQNLQFEIMNPKYQIVLDGKLNFIRQNKFPGFKFVGRTCFGLMESVELITLLKNKETPIDSWINYDESIGLSISINNGIRSYQTEYLTPSEDNYAKSSQINGKRFSISKNVFPKEFLTDKTQFIGIDVYINDSDENVFLLQLFSIVDDAIILSSTFKILTIEE